MNELLVLQVDVMGKIGAKAGVLDTVKNVLDRACPMLIDAKSVEFLVVKVCVHACVCACVCVCVC